jgi:hypothetical protein
VTNLYERKLQKMDDIQLLNVCLEHGRIMEKGFLEQAEKERALQAFKEAVSRKSLENYHDKLGIALRVIKLL